MANSITNFTIRKAIDQIDKGKIVFNNLVQRNLVWERSRKQFLIQSLLQEYPINVMYASKHDNIFDILDGKQRLNTIKEFFNNEFSLSECDPIDVDGEIIDVSKKKFKELPETLQNLFLDTSLILLTFDNLTESQEREMLYRLNCGKSMSPVEHARVRMAALDQLVSLAEHPVFKKILSKSAISKYVNEELLMKWYIIGFTEERTLLIKNVRKTFNNVELKQEQYDTLKLNLDWLEKLYDVLDKKGAKKFCTKTNLVSIYPVLNKFREADNLEGLKLFISEFFNADNKERSISEEYNATLKAGSTNEDNVKQREQILLDYSKNYLN